MDVADAASIACMGSSGSMDGSMADLRRAVFDTDPRAAWIHDAKTLDIIDANAAAVAMLGHERASAIGRADEVCPGIASLGPQDWARPRQLYRRDGSVVLGCVMLRRVAADGREAVLVLIEPAAPKPLAPLDRDDEIAWLVAGAIERIDDIVLITEAEPIDGEGPRIVFVNDAFVRKTGYSREEAIGRTPRMLQGPRTQRSELARIRNALGSWQSVRAEVINYTKDGREFWLEIKIAPLADRNGRHTHWVAVERDITARKTAELSQIAEAEVLDLISSGVSLAQVLQEITLTIDRLSRDGRSSVVLLDGDRMRTGAAPHLPQAYSDCLDGVVIGPVAGSCGTAMYRRETVVCEDIATDPLWAPYRHSAIDHGLRACWSTPVIGGRGKVLASLAIYYDRPCAPTSDDIALVRRFCRLVGMAVERITQDEALRESEERFRIVAKVTADVVWDWNLVTDTRWWGEGLMTLFGYDPARIEAGPESWFNRLFPDDAERVMSEVRSAIAGGGSGWSSEYRFVREDGTVAQVRDRGYVIRDGRGKAIRMVGSMVDITGERAMQDALMRSQRMEAVGQLTGGIAHDFNNLLTVILGNSEMLADALADDSTLAALATITRTAAERGAELTNRLLAFARRQALDPRPTDVSRLIAGLDGLLRRSIGEHVEIEIVRAGGLWPALVDASQLENAVLNLCINARDAMPAGGRLTIELANASLDDAYAQMHDEVVPGQYVLVAVSDTGAGMDAETVERAFDPFFTTKEVGRGSGLGLSMVHGFVKQSRGHVKIYSELGEGTAVKLYLPRAQRGSLPLDARAAPVRTLSGIERILVVEDDDLVREHVTEQLKGLGYEVVSVANGQQALECLEQSGRFDLLFTDVVMPGGMSGRQLADAAQKLAPELPVLFTSGYTENAIVHHGRLDPGVHLLQKPYRRTDLATKIRQVLEQGRARG
jgi:PAS domain S-box-containing protein